MFSRHQTSKSKLTLGIALEFSRKTGIRFISKNFARGSRLPRHITIWACLMRRCTSTIRFPGGFFGWCHRKWKDFLQQNAEKSHCHFKILRGEIEKLHETPSMSTIKQMLMIGVMKFWRVKKYKKKTWWMSSSQSMVHPSSWLKAWK